ncbi:MAG: energy-coupling factor transporter transmembrane component T family protein [Sphaerochaetaceae bacterium]
MSFDSFIRRDSLLCKADARLKILLLALISAIAFMRIKPSAMLCLSLALIVFSCTQTGLKTSLSVFRSILPVLVIMTLLSPFSARDGAAVLRFRDTVLLTAAGRDGLILIGSRFIILTYSFSLILQTTPQGVLIAALRWFGISFKASLYISLILSFLPAMAHDFVQISESHMLRQEQHRGRRRLKEVVPSLISAMVFALRRVPLTAMTLEQRGLGGQGGKTGQYRVLGSFWPSVPILAVAIGFAAAFAVLFAA